MHIWQTFGHTRAKSVLERQLSADLFSHAYLFVGPEQIGKKTLATEFAALLLDAKSVLTHPDFLFLDARDYGGIEQVREFIKRMGTKPFVAKRTVALIDNADELTSEASNALLKTLEEPGSATVVLLISRQGGVLPTIESRCLTLSFTHCSKHQLQEYLQSKAITPSSELLELSGGAIGALHRYSEDDEAFQALTKVVSKLHSASDSSLYEKFVVVQEFSDIEQEILYEALVCWSRMLSRTELTARRLRNILNALAQLSSNVNRKHVLYQAVS